MNCTWILLKWLIIGYNNLKILKIIILNYYLQRINKTMIHLLIIAYKTTNIIY